MALKTTKQDLDALRVVFFEGASRLSTNWVRKEMSFAEFAARCANSAETKETAEQYAAMTKDEQSKIKDVGGFVGAILKDGKRKKENVEARTLITLDADQCEGVTLDDIWTKVRVCFPSVAAVLYTTHKHTEQSPRFRLLFPISRNATPDEYEPIARRVAAKIGIDYFDPTTYETARLFFWPSNSKGADFVCLRNQGGLLDVDEILGEYLDPFDASEWPRGSTEAPPEKIRGKKAADPTEKAGVIGAFCRAYTISEAIDQFLPDVYEPTAQPDRYTYKEGTTAGGLVVYGDEFAYSHHATDPTSMQLCNAFDLVRLHKFGALDKGGKTDDPTKAKSYKSMLEFIEKDEKTKAQLDADLYEKAKADFGHLEAPQSENDEKTSNNTPEWFEGLEREKNNGAKVKATHKNLSTIFANDPKLKGKIWLNDFTRQVCGAKNLPWPKTTEEWTDRDDANLRVYFETHYGITGKEKINDAFIVTYNANKVHPIREYLGGLKWDGVGRLDRLFVDYLGADDTPVNRAMTRKQMAAAVARVMTPGCKYDYCLVLAGGEGIGKSTVLHILGGEWFNDSITTTEGKEGMESLRRAWLIELAELASIKKSDVEQVKHFLTKTADTFRAAYGKYTEENKRQCVFFGTTNETNFLKGDTGNRRFWVIPVDAAKRAFKGNIFEELERQRDQIWAEAVATWKRGEPLYLSADLEAEAKKRQKEYNSDNDDPTAGQLDEFLERRIPVDWYTMDAARHRAYFRDNDPLSGEGTRREKMAPVEFVSEVMGYTDTHSEGARKLIKYVRALMCKKTDWVASDSVNVQPYGKQRGFVRKPTKQDDAGDL